MEQGLFKPDIALKSAHTGNGYGPYSSPHKEAYLYQNYLPDLTGASLQPLPGLNYLRAYKPSVNHSVQAQKDGGISDFFGQKRKLSQYKISLILDEISGRDHIRSDNLKSLYDDLLMIGNWRLRRPYPFNYATDKTWTDLNKMELQVRDQIRRELKDAARDTAFNTKDLREGLLEDRVTEQKSAIMNEFKDLKPTASGANNYGYRDMGGLEMGLDSPQQDQEGDLYNRLSTNWNR